MQCIPRNGILDYCNQGMKLFQIIRNEINVGNSIYVQKNSNTLIFFEYVHP